MKRSRALTLIEIVVVMTIVFVLSAITFSVVGRAKAKAKQSHCSSNLRQWGQAQLLYAGDNSGVFVSGAPPEYNDPQPFFITALETYGMSKDLKCPVFEPTSAGIWNAVGYAVNGCLRLPFSDTATTVMMTEIADTDGFLTKTHYTPLRLEQLVQPDRYTLPRPIGTDYAKIVYPFGSERHSNGGHYVCVDGHMAWRRPEQIRRSDHHYRCTDAPASWWVGPKDGLRFAME
jgi:type II secretory pathway pseudopilin PulG